MEGQRTILQEKLGLKPNLVACTLHAPENYKELLSQPVPLDDLHAAIQSHDWIQAFYRDKRSLEREITGVKQNLSKCGALWLCWPKKASGVTSDLDDNTVRSIGLGVGLVDAKVVSVTDLWSGLKFVFRVADR